MRRQLIRVYITVHITITALTSVCATYCSPVYAKPPSRPLPSLTLDAASKQCQNSLDTNQCPADLLPICQRADDLAAQTLGQSHIRTAKTAYNLGDCFFYQSRLPESEALFRRSLAVRLELLGKKHTAIAESLHGLASALWAQGKLAEAETLHRQALSMRQELLGNEHAEVASSLNSLTSVLTGQGKFGEAETLCRQALAIQQKTLGKEHKEVADTLNNLATVLGFQGKYPEAESIHRQVLVMRQKLFGEEHPDVSQSLNNLAQALESQGRYGEAEVLQRQGLAIAQKRLGLEHTSVATSINNLALELYYQGKYGEAMKLLRQALAMRQKLLGNENSQVADTMNNLALVLDRQGKYGESEGLFRQALALRQKLLGKEHPQLAECLNNLAAVLESQGKYNEAEVLYDQAVAMSQKILGPDHPRVSVMLSNLAIVLRIQGKYEAAERLARQALAMRQKRLGAEHPYVAQSLGILGTILSYQRRNAEGETLHRQSLAMSEKLLGREHPSVALGLNNLAVSLDMQQNYGEAEGLHHQALAMRKKLLGGDHPDVAQSLNNLARHFLSQAKPAQAVALLQQSLDVQEKGMRAVVSETRMQALLEQVRMDEDTVYGLLLGPGAPSAQSLALRLALIRKGRVAEAGAAANRLMQRNIERPAVKQRFDEWMSVRQQRETLLFGGLGKRSPEVYQKQLQALQLEADSKEHELAVELPELSSIQPPPPGEIVAKVAQRLPPKGVLVEVIWAKPFAGYSGADRRVWGKPHFVALLLFPEQRLVSVDLGEASQVDELAAKLIQALARPSANPQPAAKALYDQLFGKLRRHLAGRQDVYLSLDGSLNLVPFDALHDGTDYLLGRYRFHYLTSGRDLLRKPMNPGKGSALVLGNPHVRTNENTGLETTSLIYQKLAGLPSLPGAQREANTIAGLLEVQPLTGANAKEEVLRGRLAPSVLHLAMHGIFLADVEPALLPNTRSALILANGAAEKMPTDDTAPLRLPGEFGPMNRSALVFAGAWQGLAVADKSKDGLLTAEEARSLDLDGTQLVVLSACESGQGETVSGQGVYGLRRAFLTAGAETVVTSLWRVHDEATGELMSIYYGKLLDKQHPGDRHIAMIESMQALRARAGREHPYYWAPFLVIGADGPLR